jgi:hypothetical protein
MKPNSYMSGQSNIYIYLWHTDIGHHIHIMQSHTSDNEYTASVLHTSPTHGSTPVTQGYQSADKAPDQKRKQKGQRSVRNSPIMFSDPINDSSSDTQSFDEDDMYGSDSGVETISLAPPSNAQDGMTNEHIVCHLPYQSH